MYLNIGIASTTHIDRNNDRMTKGALDGMANQINTKLIPYLIQHDFQKLIGVILYGEVFQLNDGEYALGIIAGVFENDLDERKYGKGKPNEVCDIYKKYLDINLLLDLSKNNHLSKSPVNITQSFNLSDLLERYLNATAISPNGEVYEIKAFIASIGDLKIEVYPKDHLPAHFHVVSKSRKLNARFDVNTLELLSVKTGKIQTRDIKKIQTFFEVHPDMLDKLHKEYKRLRG